MLFLYITVILSCIEKMMCLTTIMVPLKTNGAAIMDGISNAVRFRCVNWPASLETLLPEGLADTTPEEMANTIRDMGFNCVRLTYSVALIKQRSNPAVGNTSEFDRFASAATRTSLLDVNPWISHSSVWDVFERVMRALDSRDLMVILDNHVSKATWCCPLQDGNRWFDLAWFNVDEWIDTLATTAVLVREHPNVIGMGLRNELFKSPLKGFGYKEWLKHMGRAATAVYKANPDLLIVAAGTIAAGNLGFLRGNSFVPQLKHSIVFESHIYNGIYVDPFWHKLGERFTCAFLQKFLLQNRNEFVTSTKNARPYFLGEFGMNVDAYDATSNSRDVKYLRCVADWIRSKRANFAYWVLIGRYYYRDGAKDYEESWGLLKADNRMVRNPSLIALLKSL